MFGSYTYLGVGIHGFGSTSRGAPTDGYGRLVYIDTHNSGYGAGWRRDSAILVHGAERDVLSRLRADEPLRRRLPPSPPNTPNRKRGPSKGDMYRITVTGPGATPDLLWQGPGLHKYKRAQLGPTSSSSGR